MGASLVLPATLGAVFLPALLASLLCLRRQPDAGKFRCRLAFLKQKRWSPLAAICGLFAGFQVRYHRVEAPQLGRFDES